MCVWGGGEWLALVELFFPGVISEVVGVVRIP